jgi:predicted TIM-barrel fold metal-dependent hydrolase
MTTPHLGPLRRRTAHPRLANRRTHRHGTRGLYYETALAGSRNSLLPTLEVTTPDHILFGTDWPAAPEPTVVRNIDNLTSFDGFTAQELRAVERDNALKLFPRFA